MQKITLACITGNCAEYTERFIRSFAPMCDEVVMVRAIGNASPDESLAIAERVCAEMGKPFVRGEYKNHPDHSDWPHVDNFAAARNLSFDLATGDLIFWADLDDILESGAELIREHANRGGYPAFTFPYKIQGKHISVPRDRMIVRGAAKWIHRVHETFEFAIAPQTVQDDRVVITHLPHMSKTGSNERNLRILRSIPEAEMTTGLLYHLHVELTLKGDKEEGLEVAKKVLQQPDLGTPEKYEVFLNLSQSTDDPDVKASLLHQAHAADPSRREALFLLANNAMNYGKFKQALAYTRQMKALPLPEDASWNDRVSLYGWAGDDIYAQTLRTCGYNQDAERVRLESIQRNGPPRIALIHATRGRPEQAAMARKVWLDFASHPELIEHIFVIDADDNRSFALRRFHHLAVPAGGGCVAAWNHGFFATTAPIVVQMSDDWTPIPQWDEAIVQRLGDVSKPAVLAISDGNRKDNLLCMAIATRKYIEQDNYFFHPAFKSMYSDNWFTELAYARKQVIEARDIVFEHGHPVFGKGKMDETYAQSNSKERYDAGLKTLERLRSGADWSSVPGFFDYFYFYEAICSRIKDGDTIAEVGCWMGRSIIHLAQTLKRQGKKVKLYAVDTFKGELNQPAHEHIVAAHGGSLRAVFEENIRRCGVENMIEIIQGDSAESAGFVKDGSLAFAYIDAAHDYDSVCRDLRAWLPKVKKDGVIAGHDAQWPEVEKAVKEHLPEAKFMGSVWANIPKA